MLHRVAIGLVLAGLASAPLACSSADLESDSQADTEFGTALVFDRQVTGFAGEGAVTIYYLDLQANDRFELVMTVTDGDLNPDLRLTLGVNQYIGSESWSRDDGPPVSLDKIYKAASAGRYFLRAGAYQEQGAGHYTLLAKCLGGPCAGEYTPQELTDCDASDCVGQTRECAFARLEQSGATALDQAGAQALFDECLGQANIEGGSCAKACEGQERAALCDGHVADIAFFSDKTKECRDKLAECVDTCLGDGSAGDCDYTSDLWETPESICTETGLNNSCSAYAHENPACGGDGYADEEGDECHAFCEATTGAWIDDLDTLCEEACP